MKNEEFNWTDQPVIGMILMNAEHDSNGNPIDPMKYYKVGKHTKSGMIAIIDTGENMKHNFVKDIWKKKGKLN